MSAISDVSKNSSLMLEGGSVVAGLHKQLPVLLERLLSLLDYSHPRLAEDRFDLHLGRESLSPLSRNERMHLKAP